MRDNMLVFSMLNCSRYSGVQALETSATVPFPCTSNAQAVRETCSLKPEPSINPEHYRSCTYGAAREDKYFVDGPDTA